MGLALVNVMIVDMHVMTIVVRIHKKRALFLGLVYFAQETKNNTPSDP